MARVLIVEDDPDVRETIKRFFVVDGYDVDEADSLREMRKKMREINYDIILLDLMLPDGDASMEIPNIRSHFPNTGVIILSAKDNDMDKILGIELGADDYITKPFNPREVIARVRAVLRRITNRGDVLKYRNLEIHPGKFIVKVNGKQIEMSTTEFRILNLLASSPGKVFSRNEILDLIWGEDEFVSDRVVDVHISSIRNKIGKNRIKTVRGVGYKFQPDEDV